LGTNPINELAKKWGLKTVSDNSDNVVFYDNHGPIKDTKSVNATDIYNNFWDAYDTANNIASKLVDMNWAHHEICRANEMGWFSFFLLVQRNKTNQVDISVRTALDLAGWLPQTYIEQAVEYCK
jgi:polyamine oxidase